MPSRSAWNCISKSFTQAPPSTRSSLTGAPPAPRRRGSWPAAGRRFGRQCFECGARNVGNGGAARQAGDGAACVGLPVGRAQAGEGGTIITPPESGTLWARDSTSLLLVMARRPSRSHCTTAPPTNTLPSHGELRLLGGLRCAGGEQLFWMSGRHCPYDQHEAACAIGSLAMPAVKQAWPKSARFAGRPPRRRCGWNGPAGRRLCRQSARRTAAPRAAGPLGCAAAPAAVVPLVGVHVEQHGACGIAHVRHMHLAVGQLPHQPAVHRAKGQLAALGRVAGAGHVVQQPLQPRRRSRHPPAALVLAWMVAAGPVHAVGRRRFGAAVCLRWRGCTGWPGLAVPQHRGFALVGDAHRPHSIGGNARLASASRAVAICVRQISSGSCSTQPGWGRSGVIRAAPAPRCGRVHQHDAAGAEVPWSSASR